MAKIILYIACTLDGFIAREDGSLDWLDTMDNPDQSDHGYQAFYHTIDTVIMGRITYETVVGFGVDWPYQDCLSYVATTRVGYHTHLDGIRVITQLDNKAVDQLRAESSKNIWLIGGGKLITEFLNLQAVDEMILTLVPVVLGKGIRLFSGAPQEAYFKLHQTQSFLSGAVNLHYIKKYILNRRSPKEPWWLLLCLDLAFHRKIGSKNRI